MKILVTGDKGFIGRHIKKYFEKNYPTCSIYGCDIKDGQEFDVRYNLCSPENDEYYTRHPFDIVFHCAAIVGGRETIEKQPIKIATDLAIDSDMFNWAVRTRQGKFVYYSSSAAYPIYLQGMDKNFTPQKLHELDLDVSKEIDMPDMMYGWTKLTGELLANGAKEKGLDVFIFRPFSGYGEDQDDTYPFPAIVKRGFNREDPLLIWGSTRTVRDWIHIDDVIEGTVTAINKGVRGPVNLGTGVPTTFDTFANKVIEQIPDYEPRVKSLPGKPRGVPYRCADVTNLHKFYFPKITLDEGIERMLRYLGGEPV